MAEYKKNDKRIKEVAAQLSKMGYKTPNKRPAAWSADTNVLKKKEDSMYLVFTLTAMNV